MASAIRKNDEPSTPKGERTPNIEGVSKRKRILQIIGAVIVTGFALWFLFGVPAYVLFGVFFD